MRVDVGVRVVDGRPIGTCKSTNAFSWVARSRTRECLGGLRGTGFAWPADRSIASRNARTDGDR